MNPRPLVACALGYAAGIGAFAAWRGSFSVTLILAAGALLALLVWLLVKRQVPILAWCAAFFLVGMAACAARVEPYRYDASGSSTEPAEVIGRVCEAPAVYRNQTTGEVENVLLVLDRVSVGGTGIAQRIRVSLLETGGEYPGYGDELTFFSALNVPRDQHNPGGPDTRTRLISQGIRYTVSLTAEEIQARPTGIDLYGRILALRESLIRGINARLGEGTEAALMTAILLGDRTGIDERTYAAFRDLGIVHVLSVSGLHVGYILVALFALCKLLRLGRRWRLALILPCLAFYCVLTGLAPSVIRAALMASIMLGSQAFFARNDGLTSWAAAGFALLIANPLQLLDAGFQLSFAAVAGLIAFSAPLQARMKRLPKWCSATLSTTLAAQIGILPLLALYYGRLPLLGLIANFIAIPLCGALMLGGGAILLLCAVWPVTFLLQGLKWVLNVWCGVSRWMADLPLISLACPAPGGFFIALWYLGAWALSPFLLPGARRRALTVAAVAVAGAGCVAATLGSRLTSDDFVMLDVGQGNCVAIRSGSAYAVFDTGGTLTGYDPGQQVIIPYLNQEGCTRVSALFLSHPHQDHIGGAQALLEQDRVAALYIGGNPTDPLWEPALQAARARGVPVHYAQPGEAIAVGSLSFRVLYAGRTEDANDASMVVQVEKDGRPCLLLTGDIGGDPLSSLVEDPVPLVQVPHHGARSGVEGDWLGRLQPRYALIPVGVNSFGHPTTEALAALTQAGAEIHRTDLEGALRFRLDGLRLRHKPYRYPSWEVAS